MKTLQKSKNNNTPKMLFTEDAAPWILEAFGFSIDKEGIIIETKTGEPAMTPFGEYIDIHKFGGLKKGKTKDSFIFYKNDLTSLMQIANGEYPGFEKY